MDHQVILDEVITTYRKIIEDRYQYDKLTKKYNIPNSLSKVQFDDIRNYFLTYLYPELEQRKELNEAFESLDNYIKNPNKLLQILIDSASIIFKYGRHLPKILNTGIKALRSFREANKFEKRIVEQAIKLNKKPPFNTEAIYSFIRKLPRKEVDNFIKGTQSLFDILHDRTQVKKIIEIVSFLISKMKKNPDAYSMEEIKGLELGHALIKEGDELFEKIGKKNQQLLIDFIVKVERDTLDKIYA